MDADNAPGQGEIAGLVVTVSEPGADPERLDELMRMLRGELVELSDDVRPVSAGEAPEGTRGIDVAAVGALLVAVHTSVDAVTAIVSAVRSWLARGTTPRVVELTVAGTTLRLDSASEQQQQQLVDEFLRAVRAS
jgi:hypothetical protein